MNNPSIIRSLSDIHVIGPCMINPQAKAVETEAEKLCKALGIYLPNLQDYNTMSAYMFPHTSRERLLAIIMFHNLLFYIDEELDRNDESTPHQIDRRRLFDRLIDVFITGQMSTDPKALERTTLKVRELILPLASKEWLKRLILNTQKHLKATTYDSGVDLKSEGDDLLRYFISIRELDGGMFTTLDLIEFANDVVLPKEILEHPVVLEAIVETTRAATLLNDLFSYQREVGIQGSSFNLIPVMQQAFNLSFEAAVHRAVILINETIASFLSKGEKLPVFEDESWNEMTQVYYASLKDQLNAAWHWQFSGTNRYRSPESPFEELRTYIE